LSFGLQHNRRNTKNIKLMVDTDISVLRLTQQVCQQDTITVPKQGGLKAAPGMTIPP
jgi:hypothetical protein